MGGLEIFHALFPIASYEYFSISHSLGSFIILLIMLIPVASLKFYELKIGTFEIKYASLINIIIAACFIGIMFMNNPFYMISGIALLIFFTSRRGKWNII